VLEGLLPDARIGAWVFEWQSLHVKQFAAAIRRISLGYDRCKSSGGHRSRRLRRAVTGSKTLPWKRGVTHDRVRLQWPRVLASPPRTAISA
jgi:hypothetical protein